MHVIYVYMLYNIKHVCHTCAEYIYVYINTHVENNSKINENTWKLYAECIFIVVKNAIDDLAILNGFCVTDTFYVNFVRNL